MNLKDLLTFVKAGYKPADVKELLAMVKDDPQPEESPEIQQKDAAQPDAKKDDDKGESSDTRTDDHIAEMQRQIDDLKKQLQEAQNKNQNQDLSGGSQPDNQQTINDMVRSFMYRRLIYGKKINRK